MSRLDLSFLGLPEVRHHGQRVRLPTRKVLALLIYLAVEGGRHSREALAVLFWPESDARRGRAALRNTVARLKACLHHPQPATTRGSEGGHLMVEHSSVAFDFRSEFALDINALHTGFLAVQRSDTPHSRLVAQLKEAAGIYRGSFLEGFSLSDAPEFDDWASLQRELWHQRATLVYERLLELQIESGDKTGAVDAATKWVAMDPLNETAYRRLMEAYLVHGDRNGALGVYQKCRATLRRELDVEPEAATVSLAERIRTVSVGQIRKPPETRGRGGPSRPMMPFTGRATEYARLMETYRAISSGQCQGVILEGEPGIGKTRLATEFLDWAAAWGAEVLQGQALETGRHLPYHPVVRALRARLDRENKPEQMVSVTWLMELSRLLPELRERYPASITATVDESVARTRLFEAMARLGQALARRAPVILFIDNLQWADSGSLDLLAYGASRWVEWRTPLLLLFALRSGATAGANQVHDADASLADWISGLERELSLTRLSLGPFSTADTLQITDAMVRLPGSPPSRLPGAAGLPAGPPHSPSGMVEKLGLWLFDETRGNPLYMVETLKALIERGMLIPARSPGAAWELTLEAGTDQDIRDYLGRFMPSGVQLLIQTRLSKLTPAASAFLAAASVLGDAADFDALCYVAGLGEEDGLRTLDELLVRRLLVEHAAATGASGLYAFTHDKVRDVVYATAGHVRRRTYHRRALALLGTRGVPYAELARHASEAGETISAVRHRVAAGDQAVHLFAVRDAIAQYEQARQAIARQPGSAISATYAGMPLWHYLLSRLGRAYEVVYDYERANRVYEEMLSLSREQGDSAAECSALNRLATVATFTRSLVLASGLLQQALRLAEGPGGKALLAETEWNLAIVSFNGGDIPALFAHGERALELSRELGDPELTARSLNVLGYGERSRGQSAATRAYAEDARAIYAALKDGAMQSDCLFLVSQACLMAGQPETAVQFAEEGRRISLALQNDWGTFSHEANLAIALLELGRYGEALQMAEHSVAIARERDVPHWLVFSLLPLGRVQHALMALDAARETHTEALHIIRARPSHFQFPLEAMAAAALCADVAQAKGWDVAASFARQALGVTECVWLLSASLQQWLDTEALLRSGNAKEAQELVERLKQYARYNRRYSIPYFRSLAVLAREGGGLHLAIEHEKGACTLAREMGLPGEEWRAQVALGWLLRSSGDSTHAGRCFHRAREIVHSLAAHIGDDRLRAGFVAGALALVRQAAA